MSDRQATIRTRAGARNLTLADAGPGGIAGLYLDLQDQALGGTWATLAFRDRGIGGHARVAAVAASPDGTRRTPLDAEPLGEGRFAWTGRLPEGLLGIEVSPGDARDVQFRDLTITRRGRASLVLEALARRPGFAATGVLWRVLGYRVRGRGRLQRALERRTDRGAESPRAMRRAYRAWVRRHDTLSDADRARLRAEIAALAAPPTISVVMPVFNPPPKALAAALASVRAQFYPHWELCVCDDASTDPAVAALLARAAREEPRIKVVRRAENGHIARATNDALAAASGSFVAFMDHDDLLPEHALFEVARALVADPDLDLVYSDEDKVDARGRRFEPFFKPDWNVELLYAQNYVNHLTVVRAALVHAVGGLRPGKEGSQDHDLLLRLVDRLDPARVRHIPRVLYHWRAAHGSGTFSDRALAKAEAARLAALDELLAARGAPHRAERGPHGFNRLVRALPEPAPTVSVVIPTRDRAELLSVVLDGLLAETDYPALEVVVVDNDSVEPATAALFARHAGDARFRVLPSPGAFNFSKLSNEGATAARGELVLFLNNDVEVLDAGWLREMVSIAVEPHVGAVGAKLTYPDGTLQHGGVVIGAGGVAGHAQVGLPAGDPGYFCRMALAHEVSGVTGACLMMRKSVFAEVGGFDAEALKVAFNDVDLCLKITAAGYRIVWTPYAHLTHHESKSRGYEDTPEKRARFEGEVRTMLDRWGPRLRHDPHYNPNFAPATSTFRM